MEAVSASETSVYYNDTTRHNIPEDYNLNNRHGENLKYHHTLKHIGCIGVFEVLTEVKMSFLVVWIVTKFGLLGRYQRFGGIYCLLQVFNVSVYQHVRMAFLPRRPRATITLEVRYIKFHKHMSSYSKTMFYFPPTYNNCIIETCVMCHVSYIGSSRT
jgi:hypothetical protein